MRDQIEYRVRPVTRYIVTRYSTNHPSSPTPASVSNVVGEFDGINWANSVCHACAVSENGTAYLIDDEGEGMKVG